MYSFLDSFTPEGCSYFGTGIVSVKNKSVGTIRFVSFPIGLSSLLRESMLEVAGAYLKIRTPKLYYSAWKCSDYDVAVTVRLDGF